MRSNTGTGLRDRLRYRLDLLLSQGTWAVLMFLGGVTLLVVTISAAMLSISDVTFAGSEKSSLLEDFWQTMLRTMDPGTMAGDVGWGRRILALLVTLFGILVAGTLIGLIASGVEQRVEEMQRGRSVVVESDHVVILGTSPRLPVVVDQLTLASRERGGSTIVILADREPRELADEVRSVVPDTRGSRLVVRRGDPTRRTDLALVGVARARETIVLADDDPGSDARAVTTTLALGAELNGFDKIPIIVELQDPHTAASLGQVCAGQVHPLVPSLAVARLTAFALREPGLHHVMDELLDFHGSDIYVRPIGDLAGTTFGEVVRSFTKAHPIGRMSPSGGVELNPPPDTVLTDGDRLIVVADDDRLILATRDAPASMMPPVSERATLHESRKGDVLVIGWNQLGNLLFDQLSDSAAPGSTLEVIYDARLFDAEELNLAGTEDLTLTLTPTKVDIWQPDDARQLSEFTTIVFLGYRHGSSAQQADSRTLLNVMTLTQTLDQQDVARPRIVAELLDADNVDLAHLSGADDCLFSDAMASRLLAQLAEQPERRNVFLRLYAPDGPTVHLVEVGELGVDGRLSWAEVIDRVYAHGYIAIGWRHAPARGGRMVLNPGSSDAVELAHDDHVVVIA
jgi:Trk K+ transport system NAD-binding subunit